jgi:hypothetical protein
MPMMASRCPHQVCQQNVDMLRSGAQPPLVCSNNSGCDA